MDAIATRKQILSVVFYFFMLNIDIVILYLVKDANYAGKMISSDNSGINSYDVTLTCFNNGTLSYESCLVDGCQKEQLTDQCNNVIEGYSQIQQGCTVNAGT